MQSTRSEYCPNLYLLQSLCSHCYHPSLQLGEGEILRDLYLYLQITELEVFQAMCMSADHKINGALWRVPQEQYEWLSPFLAWELLAGNPFAVSSPACLFTCGQCDKTPLL